MGTKDEEIRAEAARFNPRLALVVYVRCVSVVLLLSGLQNWAHIIGLGLGGGAFLDQSVPVIVATLFFAVAELVAAVGLWLLASWGPVVWIITALTECVLHWMFAALFGSDLSVIVFHLSSIVLFVALTYLYERSRDRGRESMKG